MDSNLLLGIVGIIVSIGVGFGTFYLADRRARRSRWENAKEAVLRDLSKSLGEGSVPGASVIKATIRSVLRSHNATDLSVVTLDEVADDLLRQITADPFLEAERRKKLQGDVLELKEAQAKLEADMSPEQKAAETQGLEPGEKLITWSNFAALMAGLLTSIGAAAAVTSLPPLIAFVKRIESGELTQFGIAVIAAVLTVLFSLMSMIVSRREKKK